MPDDGLDGYDVEEEDSPTAAQREENETLKQVRAFAKRKEREAEKQAARVAELEAIVQARAEEDAKRELVGAGLTERQAEVFRKAYQEVTPESINQFKAEVLGITPAETPVPTFSPTPPGGESPTKRFTRSEFEDIMRSDPMRATKVAEAGLVDWDVRTR